jgi:hypothetical protein
MKPIKLALLLIAAFSGLIIATAADAHGRHRARIGVFFGAPLVAYPYYAYPRYYHPPTYYAPPVVVAPPTYIEQQTPAAPQQGTNYWYYCRDSQTYYPYVQTCPTPWQQVVPNS